VQAKAILDLRLQRLTALGRDEIKDELDKLAADCGLPGHYSSAARIQASVKQELAQVRRTSLRPRRTVIMDQEGEMEDEDLIQRETGRHGLALATSRACRSRLTGAAPWWQGPRRHAERDAGFRHAAVRRQHAITPVLFFSSQGRVYKEKVWRLPRRRPIARQGADQHPARSRRADHPIMPLPEDRNLGQLDVMFASTRGTVRRNKLSDSLTCALRHHCDETRRGRRHRRRADLNRARRRAAHVGGRQCIRFAVPGGARVYRPHLHGCAPHPLANGDKVISPRSCAT